tara:strand:- start:105823 stop:105999 length:177 start_codon:yes stop_codon:yes gene_type:complete
LVVTLKVKAQGVAKESYATGDINIIPFVANYVDLTFESNNKKSKPVGLLLIHFINTNN